MKDRKGATMALTTSAFRSTVSAIAFLVPLSPLGAQMPPQLIFSATASSAPGGSTPVVKFDPVSTAKMVIGELVNETGSQFSDALILQAGLRILLPASERQGVAEPKILPNDPPTLQKAQFIVKDLFSSGRDPTPAERQFAYSIVNSTTKRIPNNDLSYRIKIWLEGEGFRPGPP
jgi:hypothetical protein